MVPPSPAPDDHADPAWLARLRSILSLNKGGVIIGLEGAHPACAGPLIELLLEEGAPVRVCFTARELLEAPEDARVVLLHAARDADFLNMARPVVSERRLRVLVWLRPGDRRELSRRARDFLDWMQESVDVPEFVPAYATEALRRALEEGAAIVWEGPPLRELIPGVTVLLPDRVDDKEAVAAMQKGPVVIHRPRDREEVARFDDMHRMAGGAFGIVWDEPGVLPMGATRVIAEPLDWEAASEWLASAGVDEPRIEAAKLHLEPSAISRCAGREPPPLFGTERPSEVARRQSTRSAGPSREDAIPPSISSRTATDVRRALWREVHAISNPRNEDPSLIVPRPAEWPGLNPVVDRLSSRNAPEVHVVTGPPGSGISTELMSLALQLHEQHCVVMFDAKAQFLSMMQGPSTHRLLMPWELITLLGFSAIRVGRERWGIRLAKESDELGRALREGTHADVNVEGLSSALAGASAPDEFMESTGTWNLPLSIGDDWPSLDSESEQEIVDELAKVLWDRDQAVLLAERAGLPRSTIPVFQIPRVFWSRVVSNARDGALRGGIHPILEEAARMYPSNSMFARHRGASSRARVVQGRPEKVSRAVRRIVEELRISMGREVVFVVDGLDDPALLRFADDFIRSLQLYALRASFVLAAPQELGGQSRYYDYVETVTRLDDIPVIDVYEPTQHGPGIGFFRELLARRLASIPAQSVSIPNDVLDHLAWASGGRPQECLRLLSDLAVKGAANDTPPDQTHDVVTEILRDRREELARLGSWEHRELLGSLLADFVTELPEDETIHELYSLGLLRVYPAREGGYRALPHPLLIEGLLRG